MAKAATKTPRKRKAQAEPDVDVVAVLAQKLAGAAPAGLEWTEELVSRALGKALKSLPPSTKREALEADLEASCRRVFEEISGLSKEEAPGVEKSDKRSQASEPSSLGTDAGYQASLGAALSHALSRPQLLQLCCARTPCPTELLEAACRGSDARQALSICSTVASFAHGPADAAACFLPVARRCLEEGEHIPAAAVSTAMACLARWRDPLSTTSRPADPLQLARSNQVSVTTRAHEAAGLLVLARLRAGLRGKAAGGAVAQLRLDLRVLAPWALLGLLRLLQQEDEPVVVSPEESLLIAMAVVDNGVPASDGHGTEGYLRMVLLARHEGGSPQRATARHGGRSSLTAQQRAALLERAQGLVPPSALKAWAETMPPSAIVLACRQERPSDAGLSAWLLREAPEAALHALASAAVGSEAPSGESNQPAEEDLTFFISTEADPELCASSDEEEEEEEEGSRSGLGTSEDLLLLEDDDSEEE